MPHQPRIAFIREAECIGCTRCIQACPVDAIVGAAQLMHTVIGDHCIGCDLCVPPCPVDCIDMLPITSPGSEQSKHNARLAKERHQKRRVRLEKEQQQKQQEREKRIAEFRANPDAARIVQQALEKANRARSGRTDFDRVKDSIDKLEQKLQAMKEELALSELEAGDESRQQELRRRIETWEKKLSDERELLEKFSPDDR